MSGSVTPSASGIRRRLCRSPRPHRRAASLGLRSSTGSSLLCSRIENKLLVFRTSTEQMGRSDAFSQPRLVPLPRETYTHALDWVDGQRTRATATAAKTMTSITTAINAMTPNTGKCLTAAGSGADRPEVCPASGGVLPGLTPPPGSRSGVFAGSGSGGSAVIVVDAFRLEGRRRLLLSAVPHGVSRNYPERRFLLIGRSATSGSSIQRVVSPHRFAARRSGYQRQTGLCEESDSSPAVWRVSALATPSLYLKAETERGTFGTSIDPVHVLAFAVPSEVRKICGRGAECRRDPDSPALAARSKTQERDSGLLACRGVATRSFSH